jgi:hypothetical protein
MPIAPAKPLNLHALTRCDYFSESQEFFILKQLANSDIVVNIWLVRKPFAKRVIQSEPAFFNKFKNKCGYEIFRSAAYIKKHF